MGYFASTSDEITSQEIQNAELSRQMGTECVVLLENDGTLPLKQKSKIALFGSGARLTIKGGTGSGDVNSRSVTNVEAGLEDGGFIVTTKDWLCKSEEAYKQARVDYKNWIEGEAKKAGKFPVNLMFDNPFMVPEDILIADEDIKSADCDTALYVVSRISGEGADRKNEKGDYLLYENEVQNIKKLQQGFAKVVVALNVGGIVDISPVKDVNAIVLMNQLGNLGGKVLSDIVSGKVNPSGKLSDTWAVDYMDYPSSEEFSFNNGNVHEDYYKDGIYVGYRYFDSFHKDVVYPFGYGLSYTDFECKVTGVEQCKDKLNVKVQVTNTGAAFSGKEVIQAYVSGAAGEIEKPYQELKGFVKTKELAPGKSEVVQIEISLTSLAVYDEEDASWKIEKGNYVVRVGNSSRNTTACATLVFEETFVTEKCKNVLPLDCEMEEISAPEANGIQPNDFGTEWTLVVDTSYLRFRKNVYQDVRKELTTDVKDTITMDDVLCGRYPLEAMVAQLTVEEMATLCVGQLSEGPNSVIGQATTNVPGAAGESANVIRESRNVPGLIMADGPAGLRLQPHFKVDKDGNHLPGGEVFGESYNPFVNVPEGAVDYYQYCTAIPIGWALAQSWNCELIEKVGQMIGGEMEQFGVDYWLAPAMNIHRNPLCGRNFEYYSEDPFLTGKIAAAMTNGVQSIPGKGTTIKHFAANNQEENRYFCNEHVSERALREIYLKGFEIAVKESQPFALMTSYNLLNGVHTPNHKDLCQVLLREEWGFVGLVMTDWLTTQNFPNLMGKYEQHYPISSSVGCIYAGNEVQMPGCRLNITDIIDAVNTGKEKDGYTITLADLQFNALNVLRGVLRVMAGKR